MGQQYYSTPVASRNLIRAEMKMLKHAEPKMVLTRFGLQKEQPLRKTDTVVFRRLKAWNADSYEAPDITASSFVTSEGVTPTAQTIDYVDVSTTLQQYALLFKFSSKSELMYEDDIPGDMAKLCGETLGGVAEVVCYGIVRAGTNVIYGAAVSDRASVYTQITLNELRKAARTMENGYASQVTEAVKPGPNFGTAAVEAAYPVFVHTDVVADVRDLPGFTKRIDYGSAIKPIHEREFGACEEFRFISSPMFKPYLAGGAVVATAVGMKSVGGVNADVYPLVIMGQEAWGIVNLKGKGYTSITPTILPSNQINHANPIGMFGYVGANFWMSAVRLNENHMTRIEVCVSALS